MPSLPSSGGGLYSALHLRSGGTGSYLAQTRLYADGTLALTIKRESGAVTRKTERTLSSRVVLPAKVKRGDVVKVTATVTGSSPARITAAATINGAAQRSVTASDASGLTTGTTRASFVLGMSTPKLGVTVTATSATPVAKTPAVAAPAPAPVATPAPQPAVVATPAPKPAAVAPADPAPQQAARVSGGMGSDRNASNTGVPAGTTLTVRQGDMDITTAGTVIDGLEVRGNINIMAPGVVIKNSRIVGGANARAVGLVNNVVTGHAFTIIDSEIVAANKSTLWNGIMGSNFTAERVNIHGVTDPVRIIGSNVTVKDSWLHGNLHLANDPHRWGGGETHDDSIQIEAGSNLVITGNRMEDSHNAAIQITQNASGPKLNAIHIENNFLNDGGCTINIAKTPSVIKPAVTKNTFGPDRAHRNCAVIAPAANHPTMSGNTWSATGTPYSAPTRLN